MLDRGIPCRDMGKMSRWVGIRAYGGYTVNPAGVLYSSLPLHKSEGREAASLLPVTLQRQPLLDCQQFTAYSAGSFTCCR